RMVRLENRGIEMNGGWSCHVCRPFEQLAAELPHVEGVQSTNMQKWFFSVKVGEHFFEQIPTLRMGRPGLDFFGAEMLYGSSDWEAHPEGTLISERTARRLFGKADAVGETMEIPALATFDIQTKLTVMGVYKDFAVNCFLDNGIYLCYGDEALDSNQEWSFVIYLLLDDISNASDVEQTLNQQLADMYGVKDIEELEETFNMRFRLTPLGDTYFTGATIYDKGKRSVTTVLVWASVFLVIIALLNYMNFALAQTPQRIRSINTKKVLGEAVWHIRGSYLLEHVVLAVMAFVLAVLIVLCLQEFPAVLQLLSGSIAFSIHPELLVATLAIAIVIGLLSGLYPVFFATSFAPALVLKGSFGLSPQGKRLRQVMVLVQFVVALVLTAYVGIMFSQSHFIFNSDYGFDKDEVCFTMLSTEAMKKKEAIRTELLRIPGVEGVGYGGSEIGDNDLFMQWGANDGQQRLEFFALPVDKDYLSVMGIPIKEGRNFTEHDAQGAYIINPAMKRNYPWLEVGQPLVRDRAQNEQFPAVFYPVVGITDDLQITSMRKDKASQNAAFVIMGPELADWGDRCRKIFVRMSAGFDKLETRRQVTETLQQMCPDRQWQFYFLNETLEKTYEEEFRFISQIKWFAIISILVTLIGVFCLTLFETEYRRKEIGIRKVFGSTDRQVITLLVSRYALLLLIAFVIAVPVAWYMGSQWLQSFAERTPIYWWLFPLALLLVALVTLLTAAFQSGRAATENPINSIRTE
nr:ABC transporter permease [Bacteroidaceae bacterium]